jgi:CheY-like chemotaxis protein
MSRIVLLGMPEDVAGQLTRVLLEEQHLVSRKQSCVDVRCGVEPDVAFIYGDGPEFVQTLADLRTSEPRLPVIVATRLPEAGRWLDALDAGAADYCGAPFERIQVRWILDTVSRAAGSDAPRRAAA